MFVAIIITNIGMFVFWRQDLSFDGLHTNHSPLPLQNIQIRKVDVRIPMSEMMVFTSLFSTYMRYRLGLRRCDDVFADSLFDPSRINWHSKKPFL